MGAGVFTVKQPPTAGENLTEITSRLLPSSLSEISSGVLLGEVLANSDQMKCTATYNKIRIPLV